MPEIENIALFDLDGTLCDYDSALRQNMLNLQAPCEERYEYTPRENLPQYLKARKNLILSSSEWWANIPQLKLGMKIWEIAGSLGYRRMILTAGPRRNANAWSGKKIWIDRNLGDETEVTITRDKGLVYGKVLVDDYPDYILRWLKWRPRGLVVMPVNNTNKDFEHPQVVKCKNHSHLNTVLNAMKGAMLRQD